MGARSGGGGGAAGGRGGAGGGQYLKGARRTSNPNTGRDIGSLMGQTVTLSPSAKITVGRDVPSGNYKMTLTKTGNKLNSMSFTKTFKTKAEAQSFYNLQVYMNRK